MPGANFCLSHTSTSTGALLVRATCTFALKGRVVSFTIPPLISHGATIVLIMGLLHSEDLHNAVRDTVKLIFPGVTARYALIDEARKHNVTSLIVPALNTTPETLYCFDLDEDSHEYPTSAMRLISVSIQSPSPATRNK
jgi:hypothetical protein